MYVEELEMKPGISFPISTRLDISQTSYFVDLESLEKKCLEPVISQNNFGVGSVKKTSVMTPQSRSKRNDEELDPTCAAATWKIIREKLPRLQSTDDRHSEPATTNESDKKHEEEKAKAPLVPFGIDLFYWGQEQPESSGKILKFSSQHRFWAPNEVEEEVENKEVAEMLKSRYITFAGKFEPVKHKCRAPMPNGRLCERQDRFKEYRELAYASPPMSLNISKITRVQRSFFEECLTI
ncbi:hypothetical protein JD844_031833 [Phrynosoma platyrhinos]|uniref:UV-stimulated scaffold protein A C-terminal domain-containing protein n=1 Tax=Phrynosoma platyrhinos TaxID=52577 RepID=A0ABQ7T3V5_PHRPL|nr:hypothetical protein JD844_031833 [Phrynosoma platyrhinos]